MLITDLPDVVLVKVLSYLEWEDKLILTSAVPSIENHLRTSAAWPCFEFAPSAVTKSDYTTTAENCVKEYGQFFRTFRSLTCMETNSVTNEHASMFKLVGENCRHLRGFHMEQGSDGFCHGQHSTSNRDMEEALTILTTCKDLKNVSLFLPCETEIQPKPFLLLQLINLGVTSFVTALDLSSISWTMSERQMSSLLNFPNLRELSLQKCNVDSTLVLGLAKQSLVQLNIFQEKEMFDVDICQPNDNDWERILKLKPDMKVNITFDGIILVKTMFPSRVPLKQLSLNDISNSLTKGMMDHFTNNYWNTLEVFKYTNLLHEQTRTSDTRLPFALVSFAKKCLKLQRIHFDVPLSSTTVLLLAHARKFQELRVIRDDVSYEFDWKRAESTMTPDFVQWLKESGQNEAQLEKAVSSLLGFKWKLWNLPLSFSNKSF
ncbi:uncharacterized protein LOC124142285 [Haliotis rufescens]|uniref:uncharacterized protein LOC124142285 n=1 Tax=Haliotis rufescens TaxID=6454 RepID=UPI00201F27FA|nr:uncharacterized protein LOC124142285 [Haliotis rufescens]